MAGTTAGTLSLVSVTDTVAKLASTAAVGGTTPYAYQWYRSVTTAFVPGAGNLISGATALSLTDSSLVPGTTYFYKQVVIDSNATPTSATASQLSVSTSLPAPSQNQFAQTPLLGVIDQRFDYNTTPCQIGPDVVGSLYAGQAVKIVDSIDGVPKVQPITASTDEVFGFINFDVKSQSFVAGSRCEVSQAGNVMYLYATTAIARGAQVTVSFAYLGGVAAKVTSDDIVGYAFDKATAAGQLIRVKLSTPSFAVG